MVVGEIHPILPRGRHIGEILNRHYVLSTRVKDTSIQIQDLEILETRATVTIVVRTLGSHAFHRISGRQMMLVESVLRGTYYGWSQMLLT